MAVTKDEVIQFLETEEGKTVLQPKLDYAISKGLDTYKQKTLPGLIEEGVRKAYPAETDDQKKLRTLETELAAERKARNKETLRAQAAKDLATKGIPADLADFVIGETIEDTNSNILKLNTSWEKSLKDVVQLKLGENGRHIQNNTLDMKTLDDRIKVSETEKNVAESIRLKNEKFFAQK